MKLWVLSDLHLEMGDVYMPSFPEADVCVVAGDLCRNPAAGVRWLAEHVAPVMPCVYVTGNHEFYKGSVMRMTSALRCSRPSSRASRTAAGRWRRSRSSLG